MGSKKFEVKSRKSDVKIESKSRSEERSRDHEVGRHTVKISKDFTVK